MLHSFSLLFFLLLPLTLSLTQEGLFLHRVKLGLDDPTRVLSNWNPRHDTPCNWTGVTCHLTTLSVISLSLPSANLRGPFPTLLCRLQNLTTLDLSDNLINSSLPTQISTCRNLQHLNLAQNVLVGTLPHSLPEIPHLRHLDLSGNNFSGQIPPSFAGFRQLENLFLFFNLFDQNVPGFLGNVSTLKKLLLAYNPFAAGEIPLEFGNLTNLEELWLAGCQLVGQIPASLGNLKNLKNLDLSSNRLSGSIPQTITMLSSAVQIELFDNLISGELPAGMSNLTALRRFDASCNRLTGRIPAELFGLRLQSFNLYSNRFYGELPRNISWSPELSELKLYQNWLTGTLPDDLGKNSALEWFDLSSNMFSGEIPASLCEKGALKSLLLLNNSFTGRIPDSFGQCRSLTRVRLSDNRLFGEVPAGFWGLPHVQLLDLIGNSFSGGISPVIAGAWNLSQLRISRNQFTGNIPVEIGVLPNLFEFSGDGNRLNGSIPMTMVNLAQLQRLDLHSNKLSGEIFPEIGSMKKLSELNLADNRLSGEIPPEIGNLHGLNYLDLADNLLTGEIPFELQNLKLSLFNVSNNGLTGKIPPLYANPMFKDSFLGNPGLCGGPIRSCLNSHIEGSKDHKIDWLLRSIFILAGLVFVVGIALFYWRFRNFKMGKGRIDKSKWKLKSFHKLGFDEFEIISSLDEDNVIGSGASGKVYKVVLSNKEVVAVKKLWAASTKDLRADHDDKDLRVDGDDKDLKADGDNKDLRADDGFEMEVELLGKIRHKNIVRLWCCCSYKDCKLLVYEYMPNGSLGDLLHSSKGSSLDWPRRYKIAVDAAEGLSYLHHDCVPPIVHRDVKSNNILLDGEFAARVADFGVAKILESEGPEHGSMSVIAGSCGYIAPEYAYTLRVNEKSDIYSFGVVILELVTGKRPLDPEFGEKDLVKWVHCTLEHKGTDHVLDPNLDSQFHEEMCRVLDVGLLCTSPLPINRPSMRRVVKMLLESSMENKSKPKKKEGMLSPYYYEDT